jgi:hypothetical protein
MSDATTTRATCFDYQFAADMMLATQRLWEIPMTFYTPGGMQALKRLGHMTCGPPCHPSR